MISNHEVVGSSPTGSIAALAADRFKRSLEP